MEQFVKESSFESKMKAISCKQAPLIAPLSMQLGQPVHQGIVLRLVDTSMPMGIDDQLAKLQVRPGMKGWAPFGGTSKQISPLRKIPSASLNGKINHSIEVIECRNTVILPGIPEVVLPIRQSHERGIAIMRTPDSHHRA